MTTTSRRALHKPVRRRIKDPAAYSTPPPMRIRLRRPTDGRVKAVIRLIDQSPHTRLFELARSQHLSVSRLKHLFKLQTRVAIGNYMLARRLACAAELLRLTELRIKEIARRLGYAHTPSFSRAFTRAFGLPPEMYRSAIPPAANSTKC
jgi:AraC-like DNA-binding protein